MSPDGGSVWHAMLQIGNSHIMLNDAMPGSGEQGPAGFTTGGLWLFTADCDAVFGKAVEHGAKALMPPMDAFWGDRMGKLADPFGHHWAIATRQWNYTEEEIAQNLSNWLASMQQG
ncbi:MAG: VOC family protein [bacterium]